MTPPDYLFDLKSLGAKVPAQAPEKSQRYVFAAPIRGELILCGNHPGQKQFSYQSDIEPLASLGQDCLHPKLRDWIHIAFSAHMADRLAPRPCILDARYGDGPWAREMDISFGVSEPGFWNSRDLKEALEEVLSFLTGDIWKFHFHQLPQKDFQESLQLRIQQPDALPRFMDVALFSGGLDSFAGAVHYGQIHKGPMLLVSGASSSRMRTGQKRLFEQFRAAWPLKFFAVQIPYRFEDKGAYGAHDITQRTRGFLHVSLGLVACLLSKVKSLSILENGIGVLNLPMDCSQVAQQASRPANPVFLSKMENLAKMITGQPVNIHLPYILKSKAELLHMIKDAPIISGLSETFSCDHFPDYHEGAPQCGACTSCLLRQMALEQGGIGDQYDRHTYANYYSNLEAWNPDKRMGLWKMDEFCSRIERLLRSPNPEKAIIGRYPMLRQMRHILSQDGKMDPQTFTQGIIHLLTAHCAEWKNFSGARAFHHFLNNRKKAA
ncbi:MAG TPA: 7-cyano-7-deazaguanine synthase [Opitutales bacterium]|nr:7-cyano-7-deazaguanine synthase [Opitutales bacterium]